MKFFLFAIVATITVSDIYSYSSHSKEIGEVFVGCYTDPNHPIGYRWIQMNVKDNEEGIRLGHCEGKDTRRRKKWDVPASATASSGSDFITIDFSSKGGPSDLMGEWNADKNEIKWSDGNTWPMVDDSECPETCVRN